MGDRRIDGYDQIERFNRSGGIGEVRRQIDGGERRIHPQQFGSSVAALEAVERDIGVLCEFEQEIERDRSIVIDLGLGITGPPDPDLQGLGAWTQIPARTEPDDLVLLRLDPIPDQPRIGKNVAEMRRAGTSSG